MSFKPKILVVDDNQAMLRLLGEVMTEMGAEPHLQASSTHAAELVAREKFDGVFLDWRMPEMDGLELTRRIRASKLNATAPIVMLTGVADTSAVKDSFRLGINFFLQKPVSVEHLRHLMNASRGQMLEERRRHQRAPLKVAVRLEWAAGQTLGRSVNLGADGILVSVAKAMAEATEVTSEFTLPETSEPFTIPGHVVRVLPGPAPGETEGHGVSIEFRHSQRHVRELLTAYIEKTLAALPDE